MFNRTILRRSLATGVALGLAASPAVARAAFVQGAGVRQGAQGPQPAVATHVAAVQPQSSTQSGFDWGDAGIGAGAAIVLIGGFAGGAGVLRRHGAVPAA